MFFFSSQRRNSITELVLQPDSCHNAYVSVFSIIFFATPTGVYTGNYYSFPGERRLISADVTWGVGGGDETLWRIRGKCEIKRKRAERL
jgi:hypothetical protein